jgi:beta-galactosidase
MFHGGQNPEGALSTLQETPEFGWNGANGACGGVGVVTLSRALPPRCTSLSPPPALLPRRLPPAAPRADMPIKSYDFNAPVGEFGQLHGHYHTLRRLHTALGDADGGWGSWLAGLPGTAPDDVPASSQDYSRLRWSARSDGYAGMLFVGNHVRNYLDMANTSSLTPDFPGVRFALKRADGTVVSVPPASRPAIDVPSGAYWMWPFNASVTVRSSGQRTGAVLAYVTGQPVAALEAWDGPTSLLHVFAAPRGAASVEFGFYAAQGLAVGSAPGGAVIHPPDADGVIVVSDIVPGTAAAVMLETPGGVFVTLLFLSDDQSTRLWKATVAGRPRLFLSPPSPPPPGGQPAFEDDADTALLFDPATPNMLRLRLATGSTPALGVLPAPEALAMYGSGSMLPATPDGLFTTYTIPPLPGTFPPPPQVAVSFQQTRPAGPPRGVPINRAGVAAAPGPDGSDAAFASGAALYRLTLDPAGGAPPDPSQFDVRLRLNYTGDVARLYLNGVMIEDHFYNGGPMAVGLTRYAGAGVYDPSANLTLAVLPLNASYPIYVVPPAFNAAGAAVGLASADVLQVWDVTLVATEGAGGSA